MNIVLCLSHAIEEYDQLRLLSSLGYDVFSIGGYIDPAHPHSDLRPALPEVPFHPELKAAVDALGTTDNLGVAQAWLPDPILDWADVVIFHHYLSARLFPQWSRVRHKRVIWRTVGQSIDNNEREAAPFRADGLQIVRYSPKERNIPGYAGEDALIRFYKDPADYGGWTGTDRAVVNFTQHLWQRSLGDDGEPRVFREWTNWTFWDAATVGLPRLACGPGSEVIGGPGSLSTADMIGVLQRSRVYLYTGTQPASLTLGLIEAMMVGIPVVSISPQFMDIFPPYGPDLFEGHELAGNCADDGTLSRNEVVAGTRDLLRHYLDNYAAAMSESARIRAKAVEVFGRESVGAAWKAFLG